MTFYIHDAKSNNADSQGARGYIVWKVVFVDLLPCHLAKEFMHLLGKDGEGRSRQEINCDEFLSCPTS